MGNRWKNFVIIVVILIIAAVGVGYFLGFFDDKGVSDNKLIFSVWSSEGVNDDFSNIYEFDQSSLVKIKNSLDLIKAKTSDEAQLKVLELNYNMLSLLNYFREEVEISIELNKIQLENYCYNIPLLEKKVNLMQNQLNLSEEIISEIEEFKSISAQDYDMYISKNKIDQLFDLSYMGSDIRVRNEGIAELKDLC